MRGTELNAAAERLENRAARAAYTAALAAFDGAPDDAATWERRALRLETMARDYRRAASN